MHAVTFDVGGTLIEPYPSVGHVYADVAARHGMPGLSPTELNHRFVVAWKNLAEFDYSRAAWSRMVNATFAGLVRDQEVPSPSFFAALYDRFAEPTAWRVFDDVLPALESLTNRGVKLGLISNWDERLKPLLARLRLDRY